MDFDRSQILIITVPRRFELFSAVQCSVNVFTETLLTDERSMS